MAIYDAYAYIIRGKRELCTKKKVVQQYLSTKEPNNTEPWLVRSNAAY